MTVADGEENSGAHILTNHFIAAIRVLGKIDCGGQSKRPDKFLRHATREISGSVMPVIAIETAVSRAVSVAILQGEQFRDVVQSDFSK